MLPEHKELLRFVFEVGFELDFVESSEIVVLVGCFMALPVFGLGLLRFVLVFLFVFIASLSHLLIN